MPCEVRFKPRTTSEPNEEPEFCAVMLSAERFSVAAEKFQLNEMTCCEAEDMTTVWMPVNGRLVSEEPPIVRFTLGRFVLIEEELPLTGTTTVQFTEPSPGLP